MKNLSTAMRGTGSSPRVRGTRRACVKMTLFCRFIPAGAGNAICGEFGSHSPAVHPRGCGERDVGSTPDGSRFGSSPRVRGTRSGAPQRTDRQRFIPAGAGNALWQTYRPPTVTVHPRGCGERRALGLRLNWAHGSSPRVRGTRRPVLAVLSEARFIPAGAGNAGLLHRRSGSPAVHPRGCGERIQDLFRTGVADGSSPRVRGTPSAGHLGRFLRRFIPAGAGNAHLPCPPFARWPVHPRGCGERPVATAARSRRRGSSPRVRGTRRTRARRPLGGRFIPAGAGNAGQ